MKTFELDFYDQENKENATDHFCNTRRHSFSQVYKDQLSKEIEEGIYQLEKDQKILFSYI